MDVMLTPRSKKAGTTGHASFKRKRDEILHSKTTNWVEIDLLRKGRASFSQRRAKCDYRILVSPTSKRPSGDFWPIQLPQRLPSVPIPLRKEDGSVTVDFQRILDSAYDRGAYDRTIDYRRDAVPALSAEAA